MDVQQQQPTPILDTTTQSQPQRENSFFRWLEDPSEDLYFLSLMLQGKEVVGDDEQGNPIIEIKGAPLMNAKGVHMTMTFLRTISGKNTYMSNLDDNRFYEICTFASVSYTSKLIKGAISGEYAIKTEDIDFIVECINNVLEMSLRRPINQGEREIVRSNKTEHNVTQRVSDTTNQGQGIMSWFKGR